MQSPEELSLQLLSLHVVGVVSRAARRPLAVAWRRGAAVVVVAPAPVAWRRAVARHHRVVVAAVRLLLVVCVTLQIELRASPQSVSQRRRDVSVRHRVNRVARLPPPQPPHRRRRRPDARSPHGERRVVVVVAVVGRRLVRLVVHAARLLQLLRQLHRLLDRPLEGATAAALAARVAAQRARQPPVAPPRPRQLGDGDQLVEGARPVDDHADDLQQHDGGEEDDKEQAEVGGALAEHDAASQLVVRLDHVVEQDPQPVDQPHRERHVVAQRHQLVL